MGYRRLRRERTTVRPEVIFTPSWNEILYEDPVTITCNLGSAALENQRYYWYKDGVVIDKDQQSFKIDHVGEEDVGDYHCRTNTSHISPPVTLKAIQEYLILQRPPVIHEGDPLTLRCHSVYGCNTKNTTFYKDGKKKFSVHDSELHIDSVDGGSSGTYRCTTLIKYHDDYKYYFYSAETYMSVSDAQEPGSDYTHQNMVRLVLSGCVVMAAAGMIFYHLRGQRGAG
ncbi:low affinity immunoglobulin gamma Fc region receptor III-B-like [Leptodactylus fuscus]|uniref:low affinity immunoglobulin gamma Fc region receptor III-B-like n=1 Tax=Leptodactylus fuscus TaxID=238119 RepID=UPI003F4F0FC3